MAVFNLSAAPNFTNPAISTLILNVSSVGSNLSLVLFNIDDASTTNLFLTRSFPNIGQSGSSQIIWNFCNVTSVTINSQVCGSVLAPMANVTVSNSGEIDGTLAANSLYQYNAIQQPRATFPTCIIS